MRADMPQTALAYYPMGSTFLVKVDTIRLRRTDLAPGTVSGVTAAVIDATGATVSGSSIALTADGATWWGEIPHTIALTEGAVYRVRVTVTADSKVLVLERQLKAEFARW